MKYKLHNQKIRGTTRNCSSLGNGNFYAKTCQGEDYEGKIRKIVKVKPEKNRKSSSNPTEFSITIKDLKDEDEIFNEMSIARNVKETPNYSEVDFEISLKKIAPHLPNAVISQAFNMIEKQLLREILVKKTKKGYLLKIPNNSLIELDEAVYKLIKDMEKVADFEDCDFDRIYAMALDDSGLIWR